MSICDCPALVRVASRFAGFFRGVAPELFYVEVLENGFLYIYKNAGVYASTFNPNVEINPSFILEARNLVGKVYTDFVYPSHGITFKVTTTSVPIDILGKGMAKFSSIIDPSIRISINELEQCVTVLYPTIYSWQNYFHSVIAKLLPIYYEKVKTNRLKTFAIIQN